MCIFLCLKSCIFKKHHTFFAVYCVIFKNNGGLILIYKINKYFLRTNFHAIKCRTYNFGNINKDISRPFSPSNFHSFSINVKILFRINEKMRKIPDFIQLNHFNSEM